MATAFLQMGLAAAFSVGAVLLLGDDRSLRLLVATAALAGGAGALVGAAIAPAGSRSSSGATAAFSVMLFAALGVTVGGAGFLLTVALTVGDGNALVSPTGAAVEPRLSSTGAAGLGLLLGALAARVLLLVAKKAGGPVDALTAEPSGITSAFEYLDESVQQRLFGPTLIDYDGDVHAAWVPVSQSAPAIKLDDGSSVRDGEPLTLGHLRLIFVSADQRDIDPAQLLPSEGSHDPVGRTTYRARVRVRGAQPSDAVPFALAIRGYGGEVFPARLDVTVPASGTSELIEFVLVRPDSLPIDAAGPSATKGGRTPSSLLVDVSQAGTTIQLLEVGLDASPPVATSG